MLIDIKVIYRKEYTDKEFRIFGMFFSVNRLKADLMLFGKRDGKTEGTV